MSFIEIRNVSKMYTLGKQKVQALQNIMLNIKRNEFVTIFGPSGSGKTTLLLILSGLIKPTEGEVIVEKVDITKLSEDERALWRRKNIGFVFQ